MKSLVFILCDVTFLVNLQEKFETDNSDLASERGLNVEISLDICSII